MLQLAAPAAAAAAEVNLHVVLTFRAKLEPVKKLQAHAGPDGAGPSRGNMW